MARSGKLHSLNELKQYGDYFSKKEDCLYVKDTIKNKITFKVFDIRNLNYTNQYDFIFARKILYYMPKIDISEVYARLKEALKNPESDENLIIDGYSRRILRKYLK